MSTESTTAPIDQDVLAELKDLVMDDGPEFLIELLGEFVTDADSGVKGLHGAANDGDAETLEQIAHRLKSSAAHLGALQMSALCESLQRLGRSGSTVGSVELVQALDNEFVRVRAALDEECRKIA